MEPKERKKIYIIVAIMLLMVFAAGVYMGGVVAQEVKRAFASIFHNMVYTDMSLSGIFDYAFHEKLGIFFMLGTDLGLLLLVMLIYRNKKLFGGGKYDEKQKIKMSDKGTYGTAKWLDEDGMKEVYDVGKYEDLKNTIFGRVQPEKRTLLPRDMPLVSIKWSEHPDNQNTLILGPAGHGKTRYPILLSILILVQKSVLLR